MKKNLYSELIGNGVIFVVTDKDNVDSQISIIVAELTYNKTTINFVINFC